MNNGHAGVVNEVGLCYRNGLGADESSFSSSVAEYWSLAYG